MFDETLRQHNQFLNGSEIAKNLLTQRFEDGIREKCELTVMEQAYSRTANLQDDMELQSIRMEILELKSLLKTRKKDF